MVMLERQFAVLHNRAQVVLTLCGIVISTTGFSGRNVAGTSLTAQILIISGVSMILLAAGVVCWGVLHLKWLSMHPGNAIEDWLLSSLEYRDKKTTSYRLGVLLLLFGMAAYCGAIAIMLLSPNAPHYPPQ